MADQRLDFTPPSRFREKLVALCRRRRLSLKALARALGYASAAYLANIESGRRPPTMRLILSVAQYFDVNPELLLRDDLELDSPVPSTPSSPSDTPIPARGRSRKIEVGLDEALYLQIQQYTQSRGIALGPLVRAWLRQAVAPARFAALTFGTAREMDIIVTHKIEIRVEPELLAQAHRFARRHEKPLAIILRAWLRHLTNPQSPGPVPAGVKEELKRPSRRKQAT